MQERIRFNGNQSRMQFCQGSGTLKIIVAKTYMEMATFEDHDEGHDQVVITTAVS